MKLNPKYWTVLDLVAVFGCTLALAAAAVVAGMLLGYIPQG